MIGDPPAVDQKPSPDERFWSWAGKKLVGALGVILVVLSIGNGFKSCQSTYSVEATGEIHEFRYAPRHIAALTEIEELARTAWPPQTPTWPSRRCLMETGDSIRPKYVPCPDDPLRAKLAARTLDPPDGPFRHSGTVKVTNGGSNRVTEVAVEAGCRGEYQRAPYGKDQVPAPFDEKIIIGDLRPGEDASVYFWCSNPRSDPKVVYSQGRPESVVMAVMAPSVPWYIWLIRIVSGGLLCVLLDGWVGTAWARCKRNQRRPPPTIPGGNL